MQAIRFKRFLSIDSPKAVKAQGFGYMNGINYGAPARLAGVGNMCVNASPGCEALCLGAYSGQAAMAKQGEISKVLESRIRKTVYFMRDRAAFMQEFAFHIGNLVALAEREGKTPAVRPNGSWDIAFEGLGVEIGPNLAERLGIDAGRYPNLMAAFPAVPFLDYTKIGSRFKRRLPLNYHLTFSLAENNESTARDLIGQGVNVAAVFAYGLPKTYLGRPVIDGDEHDLRFLDPKGRKGYVIGLSPKGSKAKKDQSGFVLRDYDVKNA
jgi:hypothetical protein